MPKSANKSDASLVVKLLRNSVLVLTLIVFINIVGKFNNKQSPTETALMADAISSREFSGVFVRDEKPITFSGNGVLSYKISDGGKLGTGTIIAEVYSDDAQIGRNREIARLQKELDILKKIQNPGTLESAQPTGLSEGISESYRSLIFSRDLRDYTSVKNEMEDLLIDMSTYQIITKQVSGFGQQINDINNELAQLKSMSVSPTEYVKSNGSAYFVSYCDGYESELTPDSMDRLTIADINSITDRKSDEKTIVGKMINGYSWYLVGVIDNSRKEYSIGESVRLKFEFSDETFRAEVKELRNDGDFSKTIIVVECSQFNYELVQHRAAKCELIKGEYKGLKVPREAIRFKDTEETVYDDEGNDVGTATVNSKGVYIRKGEQILFKKIDVIYEGSDYVLSKVHELDSSYLALYDDIMTEGDDNSG